MNNLPHPLSPDERIALIQYSLRSYYFGMASAIAFFGIPVAALFLSFDDGKGRPVAYAIGITVMLVSLPCSLMAAWNQTRAYSMARGSWNPARREFIRAGILSCSGLLGALLIMLAIAAYLMFYT